MNWFIDVIQTMTMTCNSFAYEYKKNDIKDIYKLLKILLNAH